MAEKYRELKEDRLDEEWAAGIIQKNIKRILAKNILEDKAENFGNEMLMRCQRKLSDGNTYHIFLMRREIDDYEGDIDPQPNYLIVLRNIRDLKADLIDFDLGKNNVRKYL